MFTKSNDEYFYAQTSRSEYLYFTCHLYFSSSITVYTEMALVHGEFDPNCIAFFILLFPYTTFMSHATNCQLSFPSRFVILEYTSQNISSFNLST